MAFYGDLSFTTIGAIYTIGCVISAALKAVVGGEVLTGELRLHEIDLLSKMCPTAFIQLLFMGFVSGEISDITSRGIEFYGDLKLVSVVLLSGVCAIALNVSSFTANKVTAPLTLCIAGNVKQVHFDT